MAEAFSAICVDGKLKRLSPQCTQTLPGCRTGAGAPLGCSAETAGGGSLRRRASAARLPRTKARPPGRAAGRPPAHRQLCLPARARLRLGGLRRRRRANELGAGRRGKRPAAAAAVSCSRSAPGGEAGGQQLRYLQPAGRAHLNPEPRRQTYKETRVAGPAEACGHAASRAGRGAAGVLSIPHLGPLGSGKGLPRPG